MQSNMCRCHVTLCKFDFPPEGCDGYSVFHTFLLSKRVHVCTHLHRALKPGIALHCFWGFLALIAGGSRQLDTSWGPVSYCITFLFQTTVFLLAIKHRRRCLLVVWGILRKFMVWHASCCCSFSHLIHTVFGLHLKGQHLWNAVFIQFES